MLYKLEHTKEQLINMLSDSIIHIQNMRLRLGKSVCVDDNLEYGLRRFVELPMNAPDANDSTPEPSAHCPNCGSKDHNIGGCQEPTYYVPPIKSGGFGPLGGEIDWAKTATEAAQSCAQSETIDWTTAMVLVGGGVKVQVKSPVAWLDLFLGENKAIIFHRDGVYRRKPSPATPDKNEDAALPAANQTVNSPSCAYLLGRIENLEDVVRKLISKSEYEKVRHE